MKKIKNKPYRFCLLFCLVFVLLYLPNTALASNEEAFFAGGCFWCLEHDLENIPGVLLAESGYSGGNVNYPTYREVSSETTGHQETVKVLFEASKLDYRKLLRNYWRNIDPFDEDGQFCDQGDSYRPIIFINGDRQESQARESLKYVANELGVDVEELGVEIKTFTKFWPAEEYHQNYAEKNSLKYQFYRYSCGRDSRLEKIWGDNARKDTNWPLLPGQL